VPQYSYHVLAGRRCTTYDVSFTLRCKVCKFLIQFHYNRQSATVFDSLLKALAILNTWTWQQATVHNFSSLNYPEDEEEDNQLR